MHESWKQARERQGGMWKRQLNPKFWGSPGVTSGPHHAWARRVPRDKWEDFLVPLSHLNPLPVRD